MSFGKIFQMFYAFLFENDFKKFWRKSESNAKLAARDKYATIDITTDSAKYIFEF